MQRDSLVMIGFLLAGIVGLWMIATIFIQDRRSRKAEGKELETSD